ncbi:MAG TPA: RDD family protein, partial [Chitinophagales bacterium]|nr:RDD family protein [Chitinophagales bacterium]
MTHQFQNANLFVRSIAFIIDLIIIGIISTLFLIMVLGKTPQELRVSNEGGPTSLMDKYQFFAYMAPIVMDSQRSVYIQDFLKHYTLETFIGIIFIPWLFLGLMDGLFGGSIGKLLTGIRVRRKDGGKASLGTTTIRFFAKIVSTLLFFIG